MWIFFGTYTGGEAGSRGIYRVRHDVSSGEFSKVELAAEIGNPSFLTWQESRGALYSVSELSAEADQNNAITAFRLNRKDGSLERINSQPVKGRGACHVTVDPDGKNAIASHYSSGSVSVNPIDPEGKLQPPSCVIQHEGSSVNARRQEGPHAHSAKVHHEGNLVLVCDLGCDRIFLYRLDPDSGILTPNDPASAQAEPGAGPRHMALHTVQPWIYVVNELNSTVTVFHASFPHGEMVNQQTISTLPTDFSGNSSCAEVALSPDNRYLYASNRGHDSLAVFAVNPDNGHLEPKGHVSTGGKNPRHFAISPDGRLVLAANQGSNSVCSLSRDPATGELTPMDKTLEIGRPVCVQFVPEW